MLKALGAELRHDTGEGDGAFLTAQFDNEFEHELGGRTLMHLAFDRLGMDHHPDAELCAVGSPVFDEILGLLRVRGDMHATVPVIPDEIGDSPLKRAANLTLMRRRLVPSGSWSGKATFRATVGEGESTEHLLTADINGHNAIRLPRRPLQDGEPLPSALDTPSKVIAAFEQAASSQLERLRRDLSKKVETDQAGELNRIRTGYSAQIAEASYEDSVRLRRALDSEEKRLNRVPDVRARAKVLALTLDEDDWLAEETWAGPNGSETTLTYPWEDPVPPLVQSDASGNSIAVFALCSNSHRVDDSETQVCESCDHVLCGACGDAAIFADCPICGLPSCGACRLQTGGICPPCAAPVRAPELDEKFAVAWRLNGGAILHVGERAAELVRSSGWSEVLVPSTDVDDPDRVRVRAYAKQNGLPLDSGLAVRSLTERLDSPDVHRARLHTTSTILVELGISTVPSTTIDSTAISEIPVHQEVRVSSEKTFEMESLLRKLRDDVPPPPVPAVLVTHRSQFVDTYLDVEHVVRETIHVGDDESLVKTGELYANLDWREQSSTDDVLAEAQLDDQLISLRRRNDAVLVSLISESRTAVSKQWLACPDRRSPAGQLGAYEYLRALNMPGGRIGQRANPTTTIVGAFPAPMESELVERSVTLATELTDTNSTTELTAADDPSLLALGVQFLDAEGNRIPPLPSQLSQALVDRTSRSFTAVLRNGLEVVETWRGHGDATRTYRTFDGVPSEPELDDTRTAAPDFGVCSDGHFYEPGTAAHCGACGLWACRACDELDHQASLPCPGCSVAVCRRCLSTEHDAPAGQCVLCRDHACSDCGRDPSVRACGVCRRTICASCGVDEICRACADMRPATDSDLARLPKDLAAIGAPALIGSDNDAVIVTINRGPSGELAIIRNGAIARWYAFGLRQIRAEDRLRLMASAALGAQVAPVVTPLSQALQLAEPHLELRNDQSFKCSWSAPSLNESSTGTKSFLTTDVHLVTAVADELPQLKHMPDAVLTTPKRLSAIFKTMPRVKPTDLALRWDRFGSELALTASGLSERTFTGPTEHNSSVAWTVCDGESLNWVNHDWTPAPHVVAHATLGGAEAVIVAMASMRAIGVRCADRTDWYVIAASPNAAAATALARSMGLNDADQVGEFTDPQKVRLSSVTNAAEVSTDIRPLGQLVTAPRLPSDAAVNALTAWKIPGKIETPDLRVLPEELRNSLRPSLAPPTKWTQLDVGAEVQQLATMPNGYSWLYERKLLPGAVEARRIDGNTGASSTQDPSTVKGTSASTSRTAITAATQPARSVWKRPSHATAAEFQSANSASPNRTAICGCAPRAALSVHLQGLRPARTAACS